MCLHCGCGEPNNRHGNEDSITQGDLKRAMQTKVHRQSGKGIEATSKEIRRMTKKRR